MLGLILSLAALSQGPSQARLHPADALVVIEVPDVPKMLVAYEKAPMIAMLRDGDVRKGFYGAFEGTGMDFDEVMTEALEKVGMPESFAKEPLAGIRHYLEGIQAASFSFSMSRAGLETMGPRIVRLKQMGEDVTAINAGLAAYRASADASAPQVPPDLGALHLAPSLTLDPWNHPYDYHVNADGTYRLRSFGADGKEGGTGDNADIELSKADAGAAVELQGKQAESELVGLFGFQGVLEFRNSAALDELRTLLAGLFTKAGAVPKRSGPFQMSGIQGELQSWTIPKDDFKNVELWLMRAQNTLLIGGGSSTPEAYAARLADPRVQSAADQFYSGLLKDFGAPTGATIVQGTLRLADYVDAFRKLAEAGDGDKESLDMLDGMLPNASLRIQLVGERFVSEIAATYPKPNDWIKMALGLAPVQQDILAMIPDDAIGAYVCSIDGPLTWRVMQEEFSKDEDSSAAVDEKLKELEEKYHFNVEKDIFGSLGHGALLYVQPLKGLPSITSKIALVVNLKDPAAMQRGIEGLMAMIGDEVGEQFRVRAKPYKDVPVWTFSFPGESSGGMEMMGFSPSLAIVKNRLIVALNARHITQEIKRALGEEPGLHVIATEGHKPPADATSFAYMDWAHLLNGLYEGGRSLAGMVGGASLPVDVTRLPEPGVFTRFYKPTIYYTRSLPNGTYMRNESSFGPEVWLGLIGAGGLAAAIAQSHDMENPDEEPDEEAAEGDHEDKPVAKKPAPAGGAEATQTRDTLKHLRTSIAVYQMDVGKYPGSLDALVSPTKNYPRGFLGADALPKDAWGHAFKYSSLENGVRYQLWSLGPDGLDQQGAGDDIVSP